MCRHSNKTSRKHSASANPAVCSARTVRTRAQKLGDTIACPAHGAHHMPGNTAARLEKHVVDRNTHPCRNRVRIQGFLDDLDDFRFTVPIEPCRILQGKKKNAFLVTAPPGQRQKGEGRRGQRGRRAGRSAAQMRIQAQYINGESMARARLGDTSSKPRPCITLGGCSSSSDAYEYRWWTTKLIGKTSPTAGFSLMPPTSKNRSGRRALIPPRTHKHTHRHTKNAKRHINVAETLSHCLPAFCSDHRAALSCLVRQQTAATHSSIQ